MSSHNVLRLKLIYQNFRGINWQRNFRGINTMASLRVAEWLALLKGLYLAACVSMKGQCKSALCKLP